MRLFVLSLFIVLCFSSFDVTVLIQTSKNGVGPLVPGDELKTTKTRIMFLVSHYGNQNSGLSLHKAVKKNANDNGLVNFMVPTLIDKFGAELMEGDGICPPAIAWKWYSFQNGKNGDITLHEFMDDGEFAIYYDFNSDTIVKDEFCGNYFARNAPSDGVNAYAYLQKATWLWSLQIMDDFHNELFRENYRFMVKIPKMIDGTIMVSVFSYNDQVPAFPESYIEWKQPNLDVAKNDVANILQIGKEETYTVTLSARALVFAEQNQAVLEIRKKAEETGLVVPFESWLTDISGEVTFSFILNIDKNWGSYHYLFLKSNIVDPERRTVKVVETVQPVAIIRRDSAQISVFGIVIGFLSGGIAISLVALVIVLCVLGFCFLKRKQELKERV